MINGRKWEMDSDRTRTILFHLRSQPEHLGLHQLLFLPQLHLTLCVDQSMGVGVGGAALCSSFTVFLFSPELVSLLESNEPSEAGDLCFNFCSQLAGSLLLLADLLLFRFLFF